MRLESVEMRRVRMPLVAPFETSFGVQTERDILLLKAITSDGEGWGECVASEEPTYSSEYVDDVPLQVDANTAYSLSDAAQLAKLDRFGLLLIEQPMPEEQVLAHAELARRVKTPICLDESIESLQNAADAIELGACRVIN